MSWGYVAVGGAMLVGSYMQADASKKASDAAGNAANAQLNAANASKQDIMKLGQQNMADSMKLADATPQELNALDTSFQSADTALKREERLIASIDPSIMEASKQAYGILKGQTAETNKPLMNLRSMQRDKLVSQLREQYGPGAESSSLGQKALQKFDLESDNMFQTNQQSTLAQLFGIGTTDVGGRLNRSIAGLQQVGQGYGALQDRQLNTRMNSGNALLAALSGTNAQVVQNAGAPYVGAAVGAQGEQAQGQQLTNLGGLGLGAILSKPSATQQPQTQTTKWG